MDEVVREAQIPHRGGAVSAPLPGQAVFQRGPTILITPNRHIVARS